MKKTIRFLSGVLVLTLICAMLSSCGIFGRLLNRNKEKETATMQPTTEATTEEANTKEAATEPTTSDSTIPAEGKETVFDANTQYEANIFISNFTEQYDFTDFDIYSYGGKPVIDFAHRFVRQKMVSVLMMIVDILYAFVDPRIKAMYEQKGKKL